MGDDMHQVATALLASKNLHLTSLQEIQSLWAGYGHICRVAAVSSTEDDPKAKPQSLILKYIKPPASQDSGINEGHIRKILSYQVEQHFYTHLAPQLPANIAVASCIASIASSDSLSHSTSDASTALLMTDLRTAFPVAGEKRTVLSTAQTKSALDWLAGFHGFWWSKAGPGGSLKREECVAPPLEHFERLGNTVMQRPGGVWRNGGYTYLATRRTEFEALCADQGSRWRKPLCEGFGEGGENIAELVARVVSPSTPKESNAGSWKYIWFATLVHGDVKSENLFTTANGDAAAFYDFQYVGLGLGVCDLAKFFTCSVPLEMILDDEDVMTLESSGSLGMSKGEEHLLKKYREAVQDISGRTYPWNILIKHWETALVDWLRFQASWGFWGNTEWLEARVTSILADETWRQWLIRAQMGPFET